MMENEKHDACGPDGVEGVNGIEEYFTPSIEDIRVGYECEVRNRASIREHWVPHIITTSLMERGFFKIKDWFDIRVPYLTKEQIEKEGWEQRGGPESFYRGKYLTHYDFRTKTLYMAFSGSKILDGMNCKDINTFRYICKLLGI